jgi:serine/threonine-protein kinase
MLRASHLIAGRYRLESQVAAGPPGELWEAIDLVQGRPVAVRLLAGDDREDAPMLERCRAVARLAASVSHASITQVVDYGEGATGEAPYVVTELVEAPSLAGLLAVGPLEAARTMNLLALAASGLQAAHVAGLVHGAISPASLLVSPDGQVKITDFVTACCAQDAPVSSPAYLAPERADAGPATPAGDLYSLGIVGYECLVGTRAFSRKTVSGSTGKLPAHHGRSLPPLPRSVPAGVAGLIDDLTAHDPAKRPASAERVSVRAGLLRDSQANSRGTQASDAAGHRNGRAHDVPTPAPTLAEGHTAILSVPVQPSLPDASPGRRRSRWPLVVAGTGAILAAVLAGWLLANVFATPSSPHDPSQPGAPASAPRPALWNSAMRRWQANRSPRSLSGSASSACAPASSGPTTPCKRRARSSQSSPADGYPRAASSPSPARSARPAATTPPRARCCRRWRWSNSCPARGDVGHEQA